MDGHHFDVFVKRFSTLTSRRAGLRVVLVGLSAGALGLPTAPVALACKRKGQPCTDGDQCCSGGCANRKRVKKKNGEFKKEQVGKCACSLTQERCKVAADCCSEADACGSNGCAPNSVCCTAAGFPCVEKCDCCGDLPCIGGVCGVPFDLSDECSETEEECQTTDDCCFEEDICAANGCVPGTVCCGTAGSPCEQGGDGCDCCAQFNCVDGTCQTPACSPPKEVCPSGHFEPCCPAGTGCTQPGCRTDAPRACPAGGDSCARPLVHCSEFNGGLNCACFLDVDGNSFCSLGFSCGRECTSHAECEPSPGVPGSRCVRCPATCGHNRGVCASPCPPGV